MLLYKKKKITEDNLYGLLKIIIFFYFYYLERWNYTKATISFGEWNMQIDISDKVDNKITIKIDKQLCEI